MTGSWATLQIEGKELLCPDCVERFPHTFDGMMAARDHIKADHS